ncbi:MAG: TIGR03905 family TSCPD domain-containing protein [Pyramidobacter sp.]|jgi:uncharacterized protein (TIGR03905 family)
MGIYRFTPRGVCAREIDFEIDGGKIRGVSFVGGCDGNLKAIGKLLEGKDAKRVSELLRGNQCGTKGTSCTDQLACAIDLALDEEKKDQK